MYKYIRARVLIDIRRPLKRGFKLMGEGESFTWIQFKYERLANFCYCCGRLGHERDTYKDLACYEGPNMFYRSELRGDPKRREAFVRRATYQYIQWKNKKVEKGERL